MGVLNSFIEFLNNGKLDVKNFIFFFVWVLLKQVGLIFNYKIDGWGVNVWMMRFRKFFVCFVDCD